MALPGGRRWGQAPVQGHDDKERAGRKAPGLGGGRDFLVYSQMGEIGFDLWRAHLAGWRVLWKKI